MLVAGHVRYSLAHLAKLTVCVNRKFIIIGQKSAMSNGSSTKNIFLLIGLPMNSLTEKLVWVAVYIKNQ